jgi:heptosyltransferase-2
MFDAAGSRIPRPKSDRSSGSRTGPRIVRFPAPPLLNLSEFHDILVVKLDFIGDWVLTTPFLRELRLHAPHATITAAVLPMVFELAAASPDVDHVLVWGKKAPTLNTPTFNTRGSFDLALVPRWDADFNGASRLAAASGAPVIVGYSERCTTRKRYLNRGFDRYYTHVLDHRLPDAEYVQNLRLLELFGCEPSDAPPSLATSEEDERTAISFIRSAFPRERPMIALAPFASEPKRMLPLNRFARVFRRLLNVFPVNVVVLGNKAERSEAERFVSELDWHASAICCLNLRTAVAIIHRARALIGMDSGPAHIAAALDTPTAVISCHPQGGAYEHENSPYRFAPVSRRAPVLVLRPHAALRPCRSACLAETPHCIKEISDDELFWRLKPFIGRALADHVHPLPFARAAIHG